MASNVAKFSIYTIRHINSLDDIYNSGGTATFTEKRAWVTGSRLFHDARKAGQRMPVIFADAAYSGMLIYFAFLTDVRVIGENNSGPTEYHFEGLTPLSQSLPKSTLIKRNGNDPLKEGSIWPYSLVYTPDFIRNS